MDIDSLMKIPGASLPRLQRLATGKATPADQAWACPWKFLLVEPDPWQKRVLCANDNLALCATRQGGKTTIIAALVNWYLQCCGKYVVVVSPSEEQSFEFAKRVLAQYDALPLVGCSKRNAGSLKLENGAEMLALPCNEKTVRCRSAVDLLVMDEASRIPDSLYGAVRPMLAVSKGRTVLLSTPFGKRGFFYKACISDHWNKVFIPWHKCPRLTAEFIEEERVEHGDLWIQQEYECKFLNLENCIFDPEEFRALIVKDTDVVYW